MQRRTTPLWTLHRELYALHLSHLPETAAAAAAGSGRYRLPLLLLVILFTTFTTALPLLLRPFLCRGGLAEEEEQGFGAA